MAAVHRRVSRRGVVNEGLTAKCVPTALDRARGRNNVRYRWARTAGILAVLLLVYGSVAAQDSDCQTPEAGIARPSACQETVLVFVTKAAYQGNFGGLADADARCQAAARRAGLPGVFRAWLSTSAQPAGARVVHKDVPYVMPAGIRVADNYHDLTDGQLAHPIDRTEYGEAVPSPFLARTATAPDGQALSPTCFGLDVASPLRRRCLGRHGRHHLRLVAHRGVSRPLRLSGAFILPGAVDFFLLCLSSPLGLGKSAPLFAHLPYLLRQGLLHQTERWSILSVCALP